MRVTTGIHWNMCFLLHKSNLVEPFTIFPAGKTFGPENTAMFKCSYTHDISIMILNSSLCVSFAISERFVCKSYILCWFTSLLTTRLIDYTHMYMRYAL